jgi:hypothetical protein
MKKLKECKKKKLSIKLPNMTLTVKITDEVNLKKDDHIKIQMGKSLVILAKVSVNQYGTEKNVDKVEVDEVESVDSSKIKEVFVI